MIRVLGLDHVGLTVSDVGHFTSWLERGLGLTMADDGRYPIGRTRLEVNEPVNGESTGVSHAAILVEDLDAAETHLRASGVAFNDGQTRDENHALWVDPTTTRGVRVALVAGKDLSAPSSNDNVERIDHLGVASANLRKHRRVLEGVFGLQLESTQTDSEVVIPSEFFVSDKYGVVFGTRPAKQVGGLACAFITVGDCEFECLQDYNPAAAPGQPSGHETGTRRDQGAISRFVSRRGEGLHHVAIKVRDIAVALQRAEDAGATLIDRAGRPGGRRSQIAFLDPRSLYGILFHFVQRTEIDEYEEGPTR